MSVSAAVPQNAPVIIAWKAYQEHEEFANTLRWASVPEHTLGSLWAAFYAGYYACAVDVAEDTCPDPTPCLPDGWREDVDFIAAALSWYDDSVSRDDVQKAWKTVLSALPPIENQPKGTKTDGR